MPVHKLTITLTVLTDQESAAQAEEQYRNMDIDEIFASISNGEDIGGIKIESVETVKPSDLEAELLEIGNDGTFFGYLEEDADEDGA